MGVLPTGFALTPLESFLGLMSFLPKPLRSGGEEESNVGNGCEPRVILQWPGLGRRFEMKQSIGDFLLRRLQEAGIRHIFGVPGDYNLELLQQLEDRGEPAWIGNCNELIASYAADGYAGINGIGALIVTNGVGALSAINGVTGPGGGHPGQHGQTLYHKPTK